MIPVRGTAERSQQVLDLGHKVPTAAATVSVDSFPFPTRFFSSSLLAPRDLTPLKFDLGLSWCSRFNLSSLSADEIRQKFRQEF